MTRTVHLIYDLTAYEYSWIKTQYVIILAEMSHGIWTYMLINFIFKVDSILHTKFDLCFSRLDETIKTAT